MASKRNKQMAAEARKRRRRRKDRKVLAMKATEQHRLAKFLEERARKEEKNVAAS